jgi:hypothetical protein
MPFSTHVCSALLALFAAQATAVAQQVFCMNCRRTYRVPGGADSGSIGTPRVDTCPLCEREDCQAAARRAQGLRDRYRPRRDRLEALSGQIAAARAGGGAADPSQVAEQARLAFELGQLETQYAILDDDCPAEVPGDDVWDGLYPGPVQDSPVTAENEALRAARTATQAAASYDRMAQREQQEVDVIVGFLNTAADGFAPPPLGYEGNRYRATAGCRELAAAQRNEAEALAGTGKRDAGADPARAIAPKFAGSKLAAGGEAFVRDAGIAARTRLEGNVYSLALLQARQLQRRALAAGDPVAVETQARSAVEFAWQARGYAQWAAEHQHRADVAHQRLLDASLTAAAAKGATIPVLLERFQASVRTSGLPAGLDAALTAAAASAAERGELRTRLLARRRRPSRRR